MFHRHPGRPLWLGAKRDSSELIEREPWLRDAGRKSVTELEMMHGMRDDAGKAEHAFFFTSVIPTTSRPYPRNNVLSIDLRMPNQLNGCVS